MQARTSTENRIEKHATEVRRIAFKLRQRGYQVDIKPHGCVYDLLVDTSTRIAIKAAWKHKVVHRVTIRGHRYEYNYQTWHFNFHRHGKLPKPYADIILCAVCSHRPTRRGMQDDYFLIPNEKITRKTLALYGDGLQKSPAGRFSKFYNNWDILPPPKKTPKA